MPLIGHAILEGLAALRLDEIALQALVALMLLLTVPAAAEVYYVAPSPSGSDTNDCLGPDTPCATFQHAAEICLRGGYCRIQAAPGVYSQKTNIVYYKVISIIGNCTDRGAVVVDDQINGVGETGPIFLCKTMRY